MNSYLFLIIGLIFLIIGAEALVKGASELALRLKISKLVVGLTIVSFGTSSPELFISMKSALLDHPEIAIGNVVGSNIVNITLVLGLTALIFPLQVTTDTLKFNWSVAMGVSVLFAVFALNRWVNWYEGAIFLIMIFGYNYYLIAGSRKQTIADEVLSGESNEDNPTFGFKAIVINLLYIVVGTATLIYGSDWLVIGATDIATDLGVSKRIIGITIVAFGTSLPELATSIVSAFRKNVDLALGNLIGSNIFNILAILGATAVIKEIHIEELFIHHDNIWMLLITLLLFPIMLTRMRISRWEGLILIAIYALYMYSLNASKPLFSVDFL